MSSALMSLTGNEYKLAYWALHHRAGSMELQSKVVSYFTDDTNSPIGVYFKTKKEVDFIIGLAKAVDVTLRE